MKTVSEWGATWFERREAEGYRSVEDDRGRWRTHVEPSELAGVIVRDVTPELASAWLASVVERGSHRRPGSRLARQTLRNVLHLVRVCFRDAIEARLATSNPFDELRVRVREARTREPWTVLDAREQGLVLSTMPMPERWIVGVALGTGARAGELWGLELADVHVDGDDPHLVIRFGGFQKPTKSGKPRIVPLFGVAHYAMQKWLALLPEFCASNPRRLAFPHEDGRARKRGDDVRAFARATRAAVNRHVRWHDLRHSCATSLLEGWWGARWALEDVQRLLGHAALSTTERYVHRSNEGLFQAAKRISCTVEELGVT